jgi:all-trans-retinol 13,14-reductase
MKAMRRLMAGWLMLGALALLGPAGAGADAGKYDVVVIGAGGGGLAAAAKLAQNGMKVLVLEQHLKVGGYMTNFERGDYTFEVSLHAIDGLDPQTGMNVPTFTDLGILNRIKPVKLDPMYRSVFPDFTINVPADVDQYEAMLKSMYPQEAKGIAGLFRELGRINDGMGAMLALSGGRSGEAMKIMGKDPLAVSTVMAYWSKPLSALQGKFIHDPKLVAVFSQLAGFAGASPDDVPAIFFAMLWNSYHRGGYYYFEGGSQSISDALAAVIRDNGGTIMLSTLATRIIVEDGRAVGVVTKDGQEFRCKYVVSNANAPDTLFKLVGKDLLPADYVKRVEGLKVGLSCFQVYMGVDKDYSEYFPGGAHEIFVNMSYDQAASFAMYKKGDPDNSSFAILNYSMVDPKAAPKGKNVIVITAILPYDWQDNWHEKDNYAKYTQLKNDTGMIFAKRAEKFLPELTKHIEEFEVGSPRTMEHFTLNPGGTIFGWDNTRDQSLLKRLPQKTPIKNLYLAGAWTFPGGGQSAVITSGVMAAQTILKQEGKR